MSQASRFRAFATVLAPCALVLGLRALTGLGPATSLAESATPPSATLPPTPSERAPAAQTAASRALLDRIAQLRATPVSQSPMDHPPERAALPEAEAPESPSPTPASPRAEFRLTATMGSGASAGALINGKFLRVGDTIAGHRVVDIDAAAFTVVLKADDGSERTLRRR